VIARSGVSTVDILICLSVCVSDNGLCPIGTDKLQLVPFQLHVGTTARIHDKTHCCSFGSTQQPEKLLHAFRG